MSAGLISASQLWEEDIQAKLLLPKKGLHNELLLRRQSSEDEGLEIKCSDEAEVDYEVMRTVPAPVSRGKRLRSSIRDFVNHTYDDSGFNSSDDDRDEVTNASFDSPLSDCTILNQDSPNDTGANIKSIRSEECVKCCDKAEFQSALNSHCAKCISNKADFQSSLNSFNMPAEIRFSTGDPGNFTDPETLSNGGQLVSFLPGAGHPGNLSERLRHSRRRRVKDNNNNDSVNPLHSYLKPPPFKLNECFQDKGLFCLLVCIVYTLILFFILGCAGLIMDLIKSALSKDDLAEIKASFSHSRQRRPRETSG